MQLRIVRILLGDEDTIGNMTIDGQGYFSDTMEPTDRGLDNSMTPEQVAAIKVDEKTAIGVGNYAVIMKLSPHFQKIMPHLVNTIGFTDVMIHPVNKPADTHACIGVGTVVHVDYISHSKDTFDSLMLILNKAFDRSEPVWCEIKRFEMQTAGLQTQQ